MWSQLKYPNLDIEYIGGLCLKAVREAYGIGPKYPTAMADWQAAKKNGKTHSEAAPRGLYAPVFFSLGNEPAGHVAISMPDGRVASSTQKGVHKGLYIHPNMADLIRVYAKACNGCTYLGWSETVEDVPVISKGGNEMTGKQIAQSIYKVLGWDNPTPPDAVLTDKGKIIDAEGQAGLEKVMSDVRNAPPWRQPDQVNDLIKEYKHDADKYNEIGQKYY